MKQRLSLEMVAGTTCFGCATCHIARIASGISEPTVARLELADGELGGREDTAQRLRAAIEAAGVEFIDENGGGPGVRLKKAKREARKK